MANTVGRAGALTALPPQGAVTVADKLAHYVRPGLTEDRLRERGRRPAGLCGDAATRR